MAEKKTTGSEFDTLMEDMRGKHSKRMNAILLTSADDDEFSINYFKLLEYSAPKLQRTEVIQEAEDQVITIEHVYRPEDGEKTE